MARVALTDGSGKWFNDKSATKFPEATRWNGNNHISVPTGSQWNHEALYYTASGRWVLNAFSAYQGSLETYDEITEDEAVVWLSVNGCELEGLPEAVQDRVTESLDALEV